MRRNSQRALLLLLTLIVALPLLAQQGSGGPPAAAFGDLHWRMVGPLRAGWATVAAGVPGAAANTFYFGSADGGVWRTRDAGRTWQGLFQHEAVSSIGALAVAPSDPRVLYVGTGQPEPRWDIASGAGVYGSRDGGDTWTFLGLGDSEHIGKVSVDPRDANVLLVAAVGHMFGPNAERGVFRSEDGGHSWQKVLFVNDDTGAVDLARDAAAPDVVFASTWQVRRFPWMAYHQPTEGPGSGIWRSRDGGRTWQRLKNGLPAGALGRIGLAVGSGSGGKRVYAAVGGSGGRGGVYRTDDGGDTWSRVNDTSSFGAYYFARLIPDPRSVDTVWAMDRSVHVSTDGGKTFTIPHGSPGGDDYHDLWIDPTAPEHRLLAADQGAIVTVNDGQTWSSWYNQPTGQLYHLAVDDRFPYWIYSGQQDNGTVRLASRSDYGQLTFRDWHPVGADERDDPIPKPGDPDTVFGSGLGGRISKWDARTGQVQNVSPWPVSSYGADPRTVAERVTWVQPLAISPVAPHALYASSQRLFRSLDDGKTWQVISGDLTGSEVPPESGARGRDAGACKGDVPTARARACGFGVIQIIEPGEKEADTIWIGADTGVVSLTRDGGRTWQTVTPPGLAEWSRVASLDASPIDAATAYVAIDRHRMDDTRPYVYRTHDFGKTWTLAVTGLPATGSVYVVRQDVVEPKLLYAGTTRGMFVSYDDGDHWQPLQLDLPRTGINDLLVKGTDLIAATQGRGIWSLDDVTPLRWLAAHGAPAGAARVPRAEAMRWAGNQNRDTPLPAEEPRTKNPPAGVLIDYVLPAGAREGTLEILDGTGKVVHKETSTAAPPRVEAEQYFAEEWVKPPAALPTAAGHHRLAWDLRVDRPPAIAYEYSIGAVPDADTPALPRGLMTLPGDYTVRLTVDGAAVTAPLKVVMDPRVHASMADLQAQQVLAGELRQVLGEAVELHEQAAALEKKLEQPATTVVGPEHAAGASTKATSAAKAALARWRTADDPDDIAGVLTSLATDVESADVAPTEPQRKVLAAYRERLEAARQRWQALLKGELSAFAH